MEDTARKIAKFLYGDNYDNSKYEIILDWLNDVKKLFERFKDFNDQYLNEIITKDE